jgi:uncharacterized membrane protein YjgN (DUF898 family)
MDEAEGQWQPALGFEGEARGFAPVGLANLLLTLVTLGLFAPWAKSRTRRYLWSHSRFEAEPLRWGGSGLQSVAGFVLLLLLLALGLYTADHLIQPLLGAVEDYRAWLLQLVPALALLLFGYGLARYRSLAHRLAKTEGGGSQEGGWAYAALTLLLGSAAILTAGLLLPWAAARLWNARWSRMRLGDRPFDAEARARPHILPWLAIYPAAALALYGIWRGFVILVTAVQEDRLAGELAFPLLLVSICAGFLFVAFVALLWFGAFLRHAVGATSLGGRRFRLASSGGIWLRHVLGGLLLVLATLGLGIAFLGYYNWSWFARRLELAQG